MITTRIYHRLDTAANWSSAAASSFGKLAKGELGMVTSTASNLTRVVGYFGINSTPTVYSSCPVVFTAYIDSTNNVAPVISEPIAYEAPASTPPAGSTISWDATGSRWVVNTEVLSLDAYPSADGNVAWDQAQGKFVVGAAVSTVGIDGGSYTA